MAKSWTEVEEYISPSEQSIKNALKHKVKSKYAKLGFDIYDGSIGVLVRRLYYSYEMEKKQVPSVEACARKAEELGLCKIIPVKKLPPYMPRFLRKYMWIDTPENRKRIKEYFSYLDAEKA